MENKLNGKNIALFLDVDGVLNQYRVSERIKRFKIGYDYTFQPFSKKVLRLAKLVNKYNLDVYLFSAWTIDDLQRYLPFKIKGDTRKWACNVNDISKEYKHSILIDDEVQGLFNNVGERYDLDSTIITYQPNYNFGLVLKDFKNIERILKTTNE